MKNITIYFKSGSTLPMAKILCTEEEYEKLLYAFYYGWGTSLRAGNYVIIPNNIEAIEVDQENK